MSSHLVPCCGCPDWSDLQRGCKIWLTIMDTGASLVKPGSNPGFTVGQAARMIGVSASTVRLWEKQGLIRPARRKSGHRRFTQDDIRHLQRVREAREAHRAAFDEIHELLRVDRPAPAAGDGSGPGDPAERIEARLMAARLERRISLRELARRAGVSPSYVSAIERGQARPSVAVLKRLTSGLGVTVGSLVVTSMPACSLVRLGDARMLDIGVPGVRIENLAPGARSLEPQLFTLEPGAGSGGSYRHEGEEFLYVLDGALEIWLDGTEHYRVRAGDSLCFMSMRGHRWRNRGRRPARVIWINTPPTF
jgi:DNA-binding transcriptional MerR regulator/quercetin dioxygenase-like cupin family protein